MTVQEIYEKYYKKDFIFPLFVQLVGLDPTSIMGLVGRIEKMGRYSKWILRLYKQTTLYYEDHYKVKEYLEIWDKWRFSVNKGKDIMKIKTLPDLFEEIKDFYYKQSQSDIKEAIKSEGLKLLLEEGSWKVFNILTYEASCLIGSHTQWCTASKTTRVNFDNYIKKGPLVVFIKDGKEKFQWNISCGFFDERDRCIYDEKNTKELRDLLGKIYNKIYPVNFKRKFLQNNYPYFAYEIEGLKGYSFYKSEIKISENLYILFSSNEKNYLYNSKTNYISRIFISTKEGISYKPFFNKEEIKFIKFSSGKLYFLRDSKHWEEIKFPKGLNMSLSSNYFYSNDIIYVSTKKLRIGYNISTKKSWVCQLYSDPRKLVEKDERKYFDTGEELIPVSDNCYFSDNIRSSFKGCKDCFEYLKSYNNEYFSIKTNEQLHYFRGEKQSSLEKIDINGKFSLKNYKRKEKNIIIIQGKMESSRINLIPPKYRRKNNLIITPYGWTFTRKSEDCDLEKPRWYFFDPSEYYYSIPLLAYIIEKKGITPGPARKRVCKWFNDINKEYLD